MSSNGPVLVAFYHITRDQFHFSGIYTRNGSSSSSRDLLMVAFRTENFSLSKIKTTKSLYIIVSISLKKEWNVKDNAYDEVWLIHSPAYFAWVSTQPLIRISSYIEWGVQNREREKKQEIWSDF